MKLQPLDLETVQHNAGVIHKNPNAIFKAGKNGKLDTIAKWNLISRAVEWIKNKSSDGDRKDHLNHIFKQTLGTIDQNLDKYAIDHKQPKLALFDPLPSKSIFPKLNKTYSVTFHKLAEEILSSESIKNKDVRALAEKIRAKSRLIYENDQRLQEITSVPA